MQGVWIERNGKGERAGRQIVTRDRGERDRQGDMEVGLVGVGVGGVGGAKTRGRESGGLG